MPSSNRSHQHQQVYDLAVPVDVPPQRVVSLAPSITESLFDLNLGSRIVGVTDSCIHPANDVLRLPKVGDPQNPDIDRIIALKPDLVMMSEHVNRKEDAEGLESAGLAFWVTSPQTVQEALNLLWEIMDIFDEPSMSERVRWIERQMDWTAGAARESVPTRAFIPFSYNPWTTCTESTYVNDLLRICGAENVFGSMKPIPPGQNDPSMSGLKPHHIPVTDGDIIAAKPDVILLPDKSYGLGEEQAAILRNLDIPAAQTGRIHLVDGTLLTWPGTRIAYALSEIPSLLAL